MYDYETETHEFVITQTVNLPANLALNYWRALSRSIADWKRTLPAQRQILAKQFSVAVDWPMDDAAF